MSKSKIKKILNKFFKIYFFFTIILFITAFYIVSNTVTWQDYKKNFIKKIYLNGISNYQYLPEILYIVLKNAFSKLDTVDLEIDLNNLLLIENNRKQKLLDINSENIDAKAFLLYKDKKIETIIRLKGDRKIHFENQKKSSYKLNLSGSNVFKQLTSFSIQKPRIRNYVNEWIFHEMAKEIGLIGLHYEFVNFNINNQNKGLFVIEEGFSNNLLKKNNKRKGPIFGLNEDYEMKNFFESKFDPYQLNFWLKKKNKTLFLEAKNKLSSLKDRSLNLEEIINVKMWADYFVLCDILFSHHGALPKSVKFYYNPNSKLFEPIPFDGHKIPPYDYSPLIEDLFNHNTIFDIANKNNFKDQNEKNFSEWLRLFFFKKDGNLNDNFYLSYQSSINKIANIDFINNFFSRNEKKIDKINAKIYLDDFQFDYNSKRKKGLGIYYFNKKNIYERIKVIKKKNNLDFNKIVIDDYKDKLVVSNKHFGNNRLRIEKILCKNINKNSRYMLKDIDHQVKINETSLYKNQIKISNNSCKKALLIDINDNKQYSKKIDQNLY